jgi:hypothetical protein
MLSFYEAAEEIRAVLRKTDPHEGWELVKNLAQHVEETREHMDRVMGAAG